MTRIGGSCQPEPVIPAERPRLLGFGGVAAIGPAGPVDLGGPKQRAVLGAADARTRGGRAARSHRSTGSGRTRRRRGPRSRCAATSPTCARPFGHGRARLRRHRVPRPRLRAAMSPPEPSTSTCSTASSTRPSHRAGVGDLVAARALLIRAIDLYAGPPLGALADELGLVDVRRTTRSVAARRSRLLADVRLALGEHAQLPAALAPEIARQPYRERLRAQLAAGAVPRRACRRGAAGDRCRPAACSSTTSASTRARSSAGSKRRSSPTTRPTLAWSAAAGRPRPSATGRPPADDASTKPRFGRAAEERRSRRCSTACRPRAGCSWSAARPASASRRCCAGLRAEALRRGIAVGWDRCPESAAGAPYRSWRIGRVRRCSPSDALARRPPGAARQEAAGALLATHLGELDRLRRRTEPAVLVIDDLQWADDATLSLLAFLAPELERLRILLAVGVRRAGSAALAPPSATASASWPAPTDPVQLTLHRPDAADVAEWVASRTGDGARHRPSSPSSPTSPAAIRSTSASCSRCSTPRAASPDGVRAVADRRSPTPCRTSSGGARRGCRPTTQAVLTVAAVIGRRFDLDVLAGVRRARCRRGARPARAGARRRARRGRRTVAPGGSRSPTRWCRHARPPS